MHLEKNVEIQNTPLTRRMFTKFGAATILAALGTNRLPGSMPKTSFASEATGEIATDDLESNSFIYKDCPNVDPNIFTGKSPDEQADIITIHEALTTAEPAAQIALDHLGLLFNYGNTTENMEQVQQSPGSYLPHNAMNFATLKTELFGPDYHEVLINSGLNIAEVNRPLEAIDQFKSQTDTRFVVGVEKYESPNTGSIPEIVSFEQLEDMPKVFENSLLLRVIARFTNRTFDSAGEVEVSAKDFDINTIMEFVYDNQAARTRLLPRDFTFNVVEK